VLRIGTLVAMAFVAAGYGLALFGGALPSGPLPVLELIGQGVPSTLVGIGLLGLALIPVIMVVAAGMAFASFGERRMLATSALVVLLLVGALVAAIAFAEVV
jgi:hypothetical protein